MPAAVTMIPSPSRTHTLSRCCKGIFKRMIIGIGRTVTSKSATQLTMPAANVVAPSSTHLSPCPNSQYARTGLAAVSGIESRDDLGDLPAKKN